MKIYEVTYLGENLKMFDILLCPLMCVFFLASPLHPLL